MVKEFFKTILYKPLFNLLVFFAWLIPGHSMGWAIIMLTALVKLLLWGPSVKGIRSPLQLRKYQPQIKEIQDRFKDDRAAQTQALLAFYKEKKVSPFSGCLPLLIQLPVILILYRVFMTGLGDIRPDLIYSFTPHLDIINNMFLGIDLSKPDRVFMPILAAGMQYLQARHFQKLSPVPANADPKDITAMIQKQSVFLFPVMTFAVTLTFPAGLALYWATSNFFQLLQQMYVAKTFVGTETALPAVSVKVRSKKKK